MTSNTNKPAPGETRVTRTEERGEKTEPKLPHERDQSASAQVDGTPVDDERARKSQQDVERGVVDTDKGPVIDQTYDRVKKSATVK